MSEHTDAPPFMIGKLEDFAGWARAGSMWPAPIVRQVYDQMAEPKWVLAMGVCASSGGMFNNYAIVQGVDHVVPVDIYLPGCPPRPEMLIHALLKVQELAREKPMLRHRREIAAAAEAAALEATPTSQMKGLLR